MTAKEAGVHITAGGFEFDRIVIPMFSRYPVKKLIIFQSHSSPYQNAKELVGSFHDRLEDYPVETECIPVDIYDFNDVFLKTLEQIKKYAGQGIKVYINISPVPKIATVSMLSAAFLSEYKKNLEIFYVSPQEYLIPELVSDLAKIDGDEDIRKLTELRDKLIKKGVASGVKEYLDIPVFPILRITDVDMEIFTVLQKEGGVDSIEELVELVNASRKDTLSRSSIQYRLDKLQENGMVVTEREDRRLKIRLKKLGEVYLKGSQI